jgi:DedD protein
LDTQLKHRLTGAIILVALAVLFVPELLTGPKRGGAGATQGAGPVLNPGVDNGVGAGRPAEPSLPVAADGAPLRSYDIDLTERASRPASVSSGPASANAPLAAAAPGPATAPAAAPAAASAAAPGNTPTSPVSASATAVPATAAPATAAARPAPDTAAPVVVASRAPRFAVQLGSFASRDTANRIAADLRARRFGAFVSPVASGGRRLYRVRVGPLADRPAAEVLQGRLAALGRNGTVVTEP